MYEKLWVITPELIENYYAAIEDYAPEFYDQECAQAAGFQNIVAPSGFFAQNMFFPSPPECPLPPGNLHTRQTLKTYRPVEVGDHITARTTGYYKYDAKGRALLICETCFIDQNGDLVASGEMVRMLPFMPENVEVKV